MKKIKLLMIAAVVLVAAQTGFSQTIVGTEHDFSAETWNTEGEVCVVCHTPHNATIVPDAPLWNRQLSAATYTMYTSATLNATLTGPDGSSKLCLSCHDGTVSVENFGAVTTGLRMVNAQHNLTNDLTDDHPISMAYNTASATADGGLNDPSVAIGVGTGTVDATMLYNGKVQCASCHDVHNSAGVGALLIKSNATSALCLTCHSK